MAHGTSKHLLTQALLIGGNLQDIGQHSKPVILLQVSKVERERENHFKVTGYPVSESIGQIDAFGNVTLQFKTID